MLDILFIKRNVENKIILPSNMKVRIEDFFSKSYKECEKKMTIDKYDSNNQIMGSISILSSGKDSIVSNIPKYYGSVFKHFTNRIMSKIFLLTNPNYSDNIEKNNTIAPSICDISSSKKLDINQDIPPLRSKTLKKRNQTVESDDLDLIFLKAVKMTKIEEIINHSKINQTLFLTKKDKIKQHKNITFSNYTNLTQSTEDNFNSNNGTTYPNNESHSIRRTIQYIEIGRYHFDTWYESFYPQELISHHGGIHICYKCLIGLRPGSKYERHYDKCPIVRPPGKIVKQEGDRTIYQIDGGSGAAGYCRNLCLIAMFFISGKVAYHEVEHFTFYVMTKKVTSITIYDIDEELVGYFSRDTDPNIDHTMSCLFILPPYMKQGHGTYLIDYSYQIAKSRGIIGSPERPLSTTGLIAFRSYWLKSINKYLDSYKESSKISIKKMSKELAIADSDIISTLQYIGKLKKIDDNYFIIK